MRVMYSTARAHELRHQSTNAEHKLWSILRNRQLAGYKFRRQVPMGCYVVDFACLDKKLIIEIDGGQHQTHQAYDEQRTRWLESRGFRVMRFWNSQVLNETDGVCEAILAVLQGQTSPSP